MALRNRWAMRVSFNGRPSLPTWPDAGLHRPLTGWQRRGDIDPGSEVAGTVKLLFEG
jgi:hypothetical protein